MPGDRSRWAESKKRLFCIGYPDLPRVIRRHLTPQNSLVSRDFLRKWAACRKRISNPLGDKTFDGRFPTSAVRIRSVSRAKFCARTICALRETVPSPRRARTPSTVRRYFLISRCKTSCSACSNSCACSSVFQLLKLMRITFF